jgi:hypothetical protein
VGCTGKIYSDKQLPGIYGDVSVGELLLEADKYVAFQSGYPLGVHFMDNAESNLKQCSAEQRDSGQRSHIGGRRVWSPL